MIKSLKRYRFLIWQLVARDIKVKYRRSFLGVAWSVLNPLLSMAVISVVFSQFFRFDLPYYPINLITGQTIFSFFSEATNLAMFSIRENAALIRKVSMPVYIFPISRVVSSLVNLGFSFVAILLVALFMGFSFTPAVLFAPVTAAYMLVFAMGIGLILAALSVYFRDIVHLYSVLLTLIIYLTPVFYPYSLIPEEFRFLINANPLTYFVAAFRSSLYDGVIPGLQINLLCVAFSLSSLLVGLLLFGRLRRNFSLYL